MQHAESMPASSPPACALGACAALAANVSWGRRQGVPCSKSCSGGTQGQKPPVTRLPQRRGLKLNPVTTLYYIAPCCFCFLLIPFAFIEAPRIMNDPNVVVNPWVFLSNAAAAFGECARGMQGPLARSLFKAETVLGARVLRRSGAHAQRAPLLQQRRGQQGPCSDTDCYCRPLNVVLPALLQLSAGVCYTPAGVLAA